MNHQLIFTAFINSVLLALFFGVGFAENIVKGRILFTIIGALATLATIADAVQFYCLLGN